MMKLKLLLVAVLSLAVGVSAHGSQAYGTLNNFDCVNETGETCHGFEIEIEDVYSPDVTYTYNYNHYGKPLIYEDASDPQHRRVIVRYESRKNPDGTWASYTAVPTGPIDPTNGHMFTNPNVNFGGEHFGVGFRGPRGAVRYFWLLDDGAGNLVRGPLVNIATPTFNYAPALPGVPAQVQAAIEPPEPPEVPVLEFGDATWVKLTRTESHNAHRVELRDLVSDDPDDPDEDNWKNGEPDEVEVEWQLLQTEFSKVGGGNNGRLENEPQGLPDGDEVVTLRYDFYGYVGPYDPESHEADCDNVAADGIHGEGTRTTEAGQVIDYSTIVVVGDYIGAQMAGFDAQGQLGLIDALQDGEVTVPYVDRTIVVGGTPPIATTLSGDLPEGMTFDTVEGILSGTPLATGLFTFTVHSMDAAGGDVARDFNLTIAGGVLVDEPPVVSILDPLGGATVGNKLLVEASAADDVEVTSLVFTVDDEILWETAGPFITNWDTTTVADGVHTLMAFAYDAAGNEGVSDAITVTVDNGSPTFVSAPPAGDHEIGTKYRYDAVATGEPAPFFVLRVKPTGMRIARTSGRITWIPDATQLGFHRVDLRARNILGVARQAWGINVVDTRPPTVPTNLAASDITSDSISLSWTPSEDKTSVAGYILYEYYRNSAVDKGWRILHANIPTTGAIVSGLPPNKTKRFRVAAFDGSGNTSARSALCTATTLP